MHPPRTDLLARLFRVAQMLGGFSPRLLELRTQCIHRSAQLGGLLALSRSALLQLRDLLLEHRDLQFPHSACAHGEERR